MSENIPQKIYGVHFMSGNVSDINKKFSKFIGINYARADDAQIKKFLPAVNQTRPVNFLGKVIGAVINVIKYLFAPNPMFTILPPEIQKEKGGFLLDDGQKGLINSVSTTNISVNSENVQPNKSGKEGTEKSVHNNLIENVKIENTEPDKGNVRGH